MKVDTVETVATFETVMKVDTVELRQFGLRQ